MIFVTLVNIRFGVFALDAMPVRRIRVAMSSMLALTLSLDRIQDKGRDTQPFGQFLPPHARIVELPMPILYLIAAEGGSGEPSQSIAEAYLESSKQVHL